MLVFDNSKNKLDSYRNEKKNWFTVIFTILRTSKPCNKQINSFDFKIVNCNNCGYKVA